MLQGKPESSQQHIYAGSAGMTSNRTPIRQSHNQGDTGEHACWAQQQGAAIGGSAPVGRPSASNTIHDDYNMDNTMHDAHQTQ